VEMLKERPVAERDINLERPPNRRRSFVGWLFDSLTPGVPVVSTLGIGSLKSPVSFWRNVVFATFIVGVMAMFAGNQVQAADVYERFAGIVVVNQVGLDDATVEVNGVKTQTSSDGSFEVYATRASRYTINVTKSGYALVSKIENYLFGNANLRITVKQAEVFEIDMSIENTVVDSRGTKIVLPANALVDANGNEPTGPINVVMYTYDLTNEPMPGDMSAVNSANQSVFLESAGAFFAEFVDASGKKYNLAAGQQATISVPAINTEPTVDLWYYDEANGVWREDGTATLVNGRFEGKVSHFSTWNFDWEKTNPACVAFTIEQSLINTYGVGSAVLIRAQVTSPDDSVDGDTQYFPIGTHSLYNIPVDSKVEFFIPSTSTPAYATVTALPYTTSSYGAPPSNTSVCGQKTLAYPKIDPPNVLGYACVEGTGKGLPYSWALTKTPVGGSETLVAAISGGKNPKPDAITGIVPENKLVHDLIGDIDDNTGVFLTQVGNCIDLNNTYTIYVGSSNQTNISNMCNVRTTSGGCSFNPNIKFVSKEEMFASINGFIWNDLNSDGVKGNGEGSRQNWTVVLTDSNGSDKSVVTNANGYYKFTGLSEGDYTVTVETRTGVVYTTDQSLTRTIGDVNNPDAEIPAAANFGIKDDVPLFNLTVDQNGNGNGTVNGGGRFAASTTVNLIATPADDGSSFAGWTPAICADSFVMPAEDLTCTAIFVKTPFNLTVNQTGNGSGTVSGDGSFAAGTTVTLTATPDADSSFAGWTPAICADSFVMPAEDLTCTASFVKTPFNLTLNQAGNGSGTVSGGGSFTAGTTVTLTATPDTGSTFAGWTSAPCADSFVMPAEDLTCTASFVKTPFNLTLNQNGNGSGTVNGGGSFTAGTTVTLTATPDASSTFVGWTSAPCASSFVMPASDLTCTATFKPIGDSIVTLKPTSIPSEICVGDNFDVIFGVDTTKTIGTMQAWLNFNPTDVITANSVTCLQGGQCLPPALQGTVVFQALRGSTASPPAINIPVGSTDLFTVNFTAAKKGTVDFTFSSSNTWSKNIIEIDGLGIYEATRPDPLTQTNQSLQITVDCGDGGNGGDNDADGVTDSTENSAPNGGDGNGDGTPDSQQTNVTSLPSVVTSDYVSLETTDSNCPVQAVKSKSENDAGNGQDDPIGTYPQGLLEFDIPCQTADIKVFYHGVPANSANNTINIGGIDYSISLLSYRKFGPNPPGSSTEEWYTLEPKNGFDPNLQFGTATIDGKTILTASFTLQDGKLGDDTGVDGTIYDDGGFITPPEIEPPECSHAEYVVTEKVVRIPFLDIPLLAPFTQKPTGEVAVARVDLSLIDGADDFKIVPDTLEVIEVVSEASACHATYSYDGTLYIPNVDVQVVIILPPGIVAESVTRTYEATLHQLPLSPDVFHLDSYLLK